ncbi:MAG: ATP-binding protein [Clostridia bacterium]|nr:ATP-binding protein [Clostridia bacterium]
MPVVLHARLQSLTVYRQLLEKPVLKTLCRLLEDLASAPQDPICIASSYGAFSAALHATPYPHSLPRAIAAEILNDDNPFSSACSAEREPDPLLFAAARRDLSILCEASFFDLSKLLAVWPDAEALLAPHPWNTERSFAPLDNDDWALCVEDIAAYHAKYGCGRFAQHRAFLWRAGRMIPVEHPDPIRLSDLKSYEHQRRIAIDNTLAFINGFEANNMLLYGDRGTGKSSTVKALLNEYADAGLRMIEVPKEYLRELPDLTEQIAGLPMKFILFIDDLSFNANDDNFAALKAVLEGGLASRPSNVLIYATSNRRHLLKESFSDRDGDDVHRGDTLQESVSLSDRFGLSLTFLLPDKQHFLEIVGQMADDCGLKVDKDRLLAAAERWAIERGGRSPRYARQFMIDVQARLSRGESL